MSMVLARTTLPVRAPYDLVRTLSCGQAFRWHCAGRAAEGTFADRRVRLEQTPAGIVVDGLDGAPVLAGLAYYLGLDQDLEAIEEQLRADRVLQRIVPLTSGIAILRQDPWECVASFIVSAFNNIPKIELTLASLTSRFGDPLPTGGRAFPRPETLARGSPRALRACILGYRAPYLRSVARLVASGTFDLSEPFRLPYSEARQMLLALPGVGDKVADCVLLFAYGKGEAFPVDVWVKRAVERWYFRGARKTEREIREFARKRFGALSGYAQQHLFVSARARRHITGGGPWHN